MSEEGASGRSALMPRAAQGASKSGEGVSGWSAPMPRAARGARMPGEGRRMAGRRRGHDRGRDHDLGITLTIVEARDKSLFTPQKPGKLAGLGRRLRVCSSRQEYNQGTCDPGGKVSDDGAMGVTELVPAADDSVRTTLKPWLRDSWGIKGEIWTITKEMDEETVAEHLKDVFSGEERGVRAAKSVVAYCRAPSLMSAKQSAELASAGSAFVEALERELKESLHFHNSRVLSLPGRHFLFGSGNSVSAVQAVQSLQIVKNVIKGLMWLTRNPGQTQGPAGMAELPLVPDPVLILEEAVNALWCKGEMASTLLSLVYELKGKEIDESSWWDIQPYLEVGNLSPEQWVHNLNRVVEWTYLQLNSEWEKSIHPYLRLKNRPNQLGPSYFKIKVGDPYGRDRLLWTDVISWQTAELKCEVALCGPEYLVGELQRAALIFGGAPSSPKAYHVHPAINSVTLYPGCALKPFYGEWSRSRCCDVIRHAALRDQHSLTFLQASGFVIILNFRTSNACIVSQTDQMTEGTVTAKGRVVEVDTLLKGSAVADGLKIDRSHTEEQLRRAKLMNAQQGQEPNEINEWEGSAQLAAATWLISTYLVSVGSHWYIRQNPWWRRLWELITKLVREKRITGLYVLSFGVTWNTVIVRDAAVSKFVFEKLLDPMTAEQKGWHELVGSRDIGRIVEKTAGNTIQLDENVVRLCRSAIEASIAKEHGIRMKVMGPHLSWRHLFRSLGDSTKAEINKNKALIFYYLAEEPHEIGGRQLLILEIDDEHYVKVRNHDGPWCRLRNNLASPVLTLDGHLKQPDDVPDEQLKMVKCFDKSNRPVSIG